MNKTETKILATKNYLLSNYQNKSIHWNIIEKELPNVLGLHPMIFYNLVYAGCFLKVSKGEYKINDNLLNYSPKEIFKRSKMHIKINRQKKNRDVSIIKIDNKLDLNFQNACNLLKSLGYKIMKPTTTFEEI